MNTINEMKEKIKELSESYNAEAIGGWITGDGPIPCEILFVGEAPGKNEVEEGKPFVGVAGKTFEKYLNSIGLKRQEVRITNTCFFRPIKIKTGKNGATSTSNRPPKPSEVKLFSQVLDDEIKLVSPKIIITLGNVPLKRLTPFNAIGDCHGALYFNKELNLNIFPMYHPSALTYNRNELFISMYQGDWQKLKRALKTI